MKIIFAKSELSQLEFKKLLFGALYHDCPEWISAVGDIPTPIKQSFSDEILEIHKEYERKLIAIVWGILDPKITWFSKTESTELLYEYDEKNRLRWQKNSYIDKLEACMDSINEIRHGNTNFFLNKKVPWYATQFFALVWTWEKLPLISKAYNAWKLPKIFDWQNLWAKLQEILSCKDKIQRNRLIDDLEAYKIWKQATKNIWSIETWDLILTGEQLLTTER